LVYVFKFSGSVTCIARVRPLHLHIKVSSDFNWAKIPQTLIKSLSHLLMYFLPLISLSSMHKVSMWILKHNSFFSMIYWKLFCVGIVNIVSHYSGEVLYNSSFFNLWRQNRDKTLIFKMNNILDRVICYLSNLKSE